MKKSVNCVVYGASITKNEMSLVHNILRNKYRKNFVRHQQPMTALCIKHHTTICNLLKKKTLSKYSKSHSQQIKLLVHSL